MSHSQSYTKEFKQGAVDMVLEQGMTRAEVGRRLGTSSKNVSRWVKEHLAGSPAQPSQQTHQDLAQKVLALEKENKQLKMEREILKKAAAFFANDSR